MSQAAFVQRESSGLWIPETAAPAPRALQAVDLFCGAGGFSLGMHQSGIDVVGALEWTDDAAITYLYNLGSRHGCAVGYDTRERQAQFLRALKKQQQRRANAFDVEPGDDRWIGWNNRLERDHGCRAMWIGDAAKVRGEQLRDLLDLAGFRGEIDIVFGGPPCQGFSCANSKSGPEDPRCNLVLEFLRLAHELGAKCFAMENVPGLLTESRFKPLWERYCETANEYGYDVVANVLDAVNYGVPQYRRRMFAIGTKDGACDFRFPMPTHWGFVARRGEPVVDTLYRGQSHEDKDAAQGHTRRDGQEQLGLFAEALDA